MPPWRPAGKAQGGALTRTHLALRYEEQLAELYHSPRPWQQMSYPDRGRIWINAQDFRRQDTMISGTRTLSSVTQLDTAGLLLKDYGSDRLSDLSAALYAQTLTGRYQYYYRERVRYSGDNDVLYGIKDWYFTYGLHLNIRLRNLRRRVAASHPIVFGLALSAINSNLKTCIV